MTSSGTGKALSTGPVGSACLAVEYSCWDAEDPQQERKKGQWVGQGQRLGHRIGEGLTALVIEVVHSPLRGVIEGAGLVHIGAGPGEQQRGGEMQGRGQCQRPGVGGSPPPLSLLQAAGKGQCG